jgi:hypothetical protein
MKKTKENKIYYFKNDEEFINSINKIPINLSEHPDIIDRIYKKYPIIDKKDISIIVKVSLEVLRELLILGNIINFNKIFFDFKLYIFKYVRNGVIFPSLRVKLTTPPRIKRG